LDLNTFSFLFDLHVVVVGWAEQMEERYSNSSSVSSPTLDDILDSLLALRRPQKKFRARDKGNVSFQTNPLHLFTRPPITPITIKAPSEE